MAMPDFVGIGAQKAGTTWLYEMLAQNPSVWLPPLKEVHYFDSLGKPPEYKVQRNSHIEDLAARLDNGRFDKGSDDETGNKAAFLRSLVGDHLLTPEWYGSIFDHPDARSRVAGEITPAYLGLDEPQMRTLSSMLTETKFLLIIREPAARAMSQLKMAIARSKTVPNRRKAWMVFVHKIMTRVRGDYQSAIPLWQKFVGSERLLILPFSRIRNEPAVLLHDIEDFIGAKRFDNYQSLDEPSHQTREIEVPAWVRRTVNEMAAPQKDYLIRAFGEEFYESTR